MAFSQTVRQVIRERISIRKYREGPLSDEDLAFLNRLLEDLPTGPFKNRGLFYLLKPGLNEDWGRLPGTYGIIRGATMFLVGAARDDFQALLDYGFQMEYIILRAWDQGIGTCWLGGGFQRNVVIRQSELPEGYIIPAITPLGYSAEKEGLIDDVMHRLMGSKQRKPSSEMFFQDQWRSPFTADSGSVIGEALEMIRLGPSAMNRQPWRVLVDDRDVHFYYQRGGISSMVSNGKFPVVDLGIACCHFQLAMKEQGESGDWSVSERGQTFERSGLQYGVTWRRESNPAEGY